MILLAITMAGFEPHLQHVACMSVEGYINLGAGENEADNILVI